MPHDPDAIVDKILWYRDNPIELKKVAENGRREALRLYGYEKQVQPRIDILRRELSWSARLDRKATRRPHHDREGQSGVI